jgi:hypothetical protein
VNGHAFGNEAANYFSNSNWTVAAILLHSGEEIGAAQIRGDRGGDMTCGKGGRVRAAIAFSALAGIVQVVAAFKCSARRPEGLAAVPVWKEESTCETWAWVKWMGSGVTPPGVGLGSGLWGCFFNMM